MKKLLLALAAFSLFGATAAQAQVATPYTEVTTSTNHIRDFPDNLNYGLNLGLEAPINSVASATISGGIENFADRHPTLTASVGLNGNLTGPLGIYGQVGVLQTNGDTGYRLGTGLSLNLTKHLYGRAGYQRDDYGHGHSDGAMVALGVRF